MRLANAIKRCFKRSKSGNSGSSGWATEKDIRSLLRTPEDGGVVIGGFEGKPLIYGGNNHVVAIGGLTSGIGPGLVIPTLMNYRGSVVVHDVRGELYDITADHRRAMGQKVIRIAPGEAADSVCFNLMDTVRVDTAYEVSDAYWVAAQVCPTVSFFDKSAWCVIVALVLHGLHEQNGKDSTLSDVYTLSQRPEIVDEMAHSTSKFARETAKDLLRRQDAGHDAELSIIMSTVARYLGAYNKTVAQTSSGTSRLDLNDLQNGDMPVTLYLTAEPFGNNSELTRSHQILFSAIIRVATRPTLQIKDGAFVPGYRHKLLLMLNNYEDFDGGIPELGQSLAFLSAYGIQSYITVHESGIETETIKTLDDSDIMSNSHIHIFFEPRYFPTAEYISKQLGSIEDDDGIRKPLLTPEEVLRMSGSCWRSVDVGDESRTPIHGLTCLTVRAGNAPIFGNIVPYLFGRSKLFTTCSTGIQKGN
jgi:type IV secretion system protein VirD4